MMHAVLDSRTAVDHFPGIGRYVTNLAWAMSALAPDQPVSLLVDPNAAATRLTLPDLPRILCPASPFSMQQQWLVPKLLQEAQATLYHSAYYLMPYTLATPAILTCYDLIPLVYPHYFTPWKRLTFRLAHRLAFRSARLILAISEATRRDLIRLFAVDRDRIMVTPLAANGRFQPQPEAVVTAVRHQYALPKKYLLYFGSNKPHKNLTRLVRAYAQLKRQSPHLVIAGHWDFRYPEAQREAQRLGVEKRVLFIGPVKDEDLPALYSGATLFIFPSLYEGFGLPVVEAMACGVPVICADVSSLPEVAGSAACLVDPTDTADLTAAMDGLLADPEQRALMAAQGLQQAAQFTWRQTAGLTLAAYERPVNNQESTMNSQ
jgi:glycosyltransferase involved in cell wall biosynthesis